MRWIERSRWVECAFKFLGTNAGLDIDMHLDPGKRFYCLFGENGVGKTNLLKNLARTLLSVHSMFLPENQKHLYKYANLIHQRALYDQLKEVTLDLPKDININGTLIKDRSIEAWRYARLDLLASQQLLRRPVKQADSSIKSCVVDTAVVMVGANGRGHTKGLAQSELQFVSDTASEFLSVFRKTLCSTDNEGKVNDSIAAWIASRMLVNPAFVLDSQYSIGQVIALCEILMEFDPAFSSLISSNSKGGKDIQIIFHEGNLYFKSVPIDQMATGYIALIKILQEIISAYGAWLSMSGGGKVRDLDGIVLIDEFDAHLHPRWQVGLVPLLKRAFPNTTFVVCTHSPLVVAQTSEGEAYELVRENRSVTSRRLGNPRDWYLADVYANAFHINLPAPGTLAAEGEISLVDLFLEFSAQVKEYAVKDTEDLRLKALSLHDQISSRLLPEDPRRKSLESLRSILK